MDALVLELCGVTLVFVEMHLLQLEHRHPDERAHEHDTEHLQARFQELVPARVGFQLAGDSNADNYSGHADDGDTGQNEELPFGAAPS